MKFLKNNDGNVQMVGVAVATLVAIIIAIMVVYNIAASIDATDTDNDIALNIRDTLGEGVGTEGDDLTNYSVNATRDTLEQSATFFTIAPLIVVVMVAVIILGYVITIGGKRRY